MKTYKEFRELHKERLGLSDKCPSDSFFPSSMKSWRRKLRFEVKHRMKWKHPMPHENRLAAYYKTLLDLGHPSPETLIATQTGY